MMVAVSNFTQSFPSLFIFSPIFSLSFHIFPSLSNLSFSSLYVASIVFTARHYPSLCSFVFCYLLCPSLSCTIFFSSLFEIFCIRCINLLNFYFFLLLYLLSYCFAYKLSLSQTITQQLSVSLTQTQQPFFFAAHVRLFYHRIFRHFCFSICPISVIISSHHLAPIDEQLIPPPSRQTDQCQNITENIFYKIEQQCPLNIGVVSGLDSNLDPTIYEPSYNVDYIC